MEFTKPKTLKVIFIRTAKDLWNCFWNWMDEIHKDINLDLRR